MSGSEPTTAAGGTRSTERERMADVLHQHLGFYIGPEVEDDLAALVDALHDERCEPIQAVLDDWQAEVEETQGATLVLSVEDAHAAITAALAAAVPSPETETTPCVHDWTGDGVTCNRCGVHINAATAPAEGLSEAEREDFKANLRQNLGYTAFVIQDTMADHADRLAAAVAARVRAEAEADRAAVLALAKSWSDQATDHAYRSSHGDCDPLEHATLTGQQTALTACADDLRRALGGGQ